MYCARRNNVFVYLCMATITSSAVATVWKTNIHALTHTHTLECALPAWPVAIHTTLRFHSQNRGEKAEMQRKEQIDGFWWSDFSESRPLKQECDNTNNVHLANARSYRWGTTNMYMNSINKCYSTKKKKTWDPELKKTVKLSQKPNITNPYELPDDTRRISNALRVV